MVAKKAEKEVGPFGKAALSYYKAGWPSVLPIWKGSARDKQPMVSGYHGRDGTWPDDITMALWASRYKLANIALRLPRWVIGLDVDHYDDKYGGDTLADLEDQLGPLPAGPVSTSRDDGVSGIRLLQVPGDYVSSHWPSQAGDDIEVITWYERYVICAPSVHKTGREYEWSIPELSEYPEGRFSIKRPPKPSDLPLLPEDWCEYLAGKAGADDARWNGRSYDGPARAWLTEYGGGDECEYMQEVSPRWVFGVMNGGSAHEAAKLAVAQAVKAVAEGHTGANSALWDVRATFITRVGARSANERRRGENKAVEEWQSMLAGAIAKYGGDVLEDDPCEELEGLY
jgi:Bifunctional DNA primase/polymerase, N-terminal